MQVLKTQDIAQNLERIFWNLGLKVTTVFLRIMLVVINQFIETESGKNRPGDWQRKEKRIVGWESLSHAFLYPQPQGQNFKKICKKVEKKMRPGGREKWPIKIIETAGKTLESVLVRADPFMGNKCVDPKCLQNKTLRIK